MMGIDVTRQVNYYFVLVTRKSIMIKRFDLVWIVNNNEQSSIVFLVKFGVSRRFEGKTCDTLDTNRYVVEGWARKVGCARGRIGNADYLPT